SCRRARLQKRLDFLMRVAETGQRLARMLAQSGRGCVWRGRRARELERRAEMADRLPDTGLGKSAYQPARLDKRRGERLIEFENGFEAAIMLVGECLPFGAAARGEDRFERGMGFGARRVELPGGEVVAADALAEGGPEFGFKRGECHPAVLAGIGAVADGLLGAPAPRHLAVAKMPRRDEAEPYGRGVEQRDIDKLAASGAVALAQRGERGEGGKQGDAYVGDLARGRHGRAVRRTGHGDESRKAEIVEVMT